MLAAYYHSFNSLRT